MKSIHLPLAFLSVSLATAPAALVDGLRNYWNFDDNLSDAAHGVAGSASTVADDATGVAGGTLTYGAGKYGNALSTNGIAGNADTHVVVGGSSADVNGYAATDTLTISGWFQVAAFDTGWQAVISKGEQSEYRVARSGGSNNLAYAGGSGDITAASVNISSGWHHFVAITDGANGTSLYINGSANVFTNTAAADIVNDPLTDLLIGANPEGNAATHKREFNGLIDDVAMWDRVLTASEIDLIYNSGGDLGSLLAVPEPSSALLGLFGLLALARRRR